MSSELKLSLENFQSISKGELIFHKGLNFIIGQSNSGKSATFRALKACLSNPAGAKRFIKKGTRRASVKLEYNGNQIIWNRTSGESSYTINGEDYIKTGKSNAFKILGDETGFTTDSNDVIMNIEEELQLPFPFGISNGDLFKLYEEVFCISDSASILKQAKVQEDAVKEKATQLELDVEKNNLKLAELEKFREEVDLDKLRENLSLLKNKRDEKRRLEEGLPIIKKAVLAASVECPSLESFKNALHDLYDKVAVQNTLDKLRKVQFVKKRVGLIEELTFDGSTLEKYMGLLDLQMSRKVISSLSEIEMPDFEILNKLNKLQDLEELNKIKSRCSELDFDVEIRDFDDKYKKYIELTEYKEKLSQVIIKGKELQAKLKEQTNIIRGIEEKLSEYKVCPLCHRPLEGEIKC